MKVTVKMKPSVNHTRRRVDRDKQTDEQVTITKWKIDINLYLASRELLGKNQQTFHSPKRTKGPEISQLFGETYSYAPASAILNHDVVGVRGSRLMGLLELSLTSLFFFCRGVDRSGTGSSGTTSGVGVGVSWASTDSRVTAESKQSRHG